MTALRQRMLEDMQIRNLAENTQESYIHQVSQFARHFEKSPDALGPEHIRTYQIYLTNEKKLAPGSMRVPCRAPSGACCTPSRCAAPPLWAGMSNSAIVERMSASHTTRARSESHDAYRINNPFDAVVKTIRFALDLRNQNGCQTKVHTSTVLTNKNISEIEDIKRFAEELGVDQNGFQPVFLQKPDDAAEVQFGMTSDTFSRFGFPPEQEHLAGETLLRIGAANLRSYIAMLLDLYARSEGGRRLYLR